MPLASDTIEIKPLVNPAEAEGCARMMAGTDPWLKLGRTYDACLHIVRDQSKEVYVARLGRAVAGFLIINMGGRSRAISRRYALMRSIEGKGSAAGSSGGRRSASFVRALMCSCASRHSTRARTNSTNDWGMRSSVN